MEFNDHRWRMILSRWVPGTERLLLTLGWKVTHVCVYVALGDSNGRTQTCSAACRCRCGSNPKTTSSVIHMCGEQQRQGGGESPKRAIRTAPSGDKARGRDAFGSSSLDGSHLEEISVVRLFKPTTATTLIDQHNLTCFPSSPSHTPQIILLH